MGKKGNIKLILPKNSGNKQHLDDAIDIVYTNHGQISSSKFRDKMVELMKKRNVGTDPTSVIHKSVMPRYFGLLKLEQQILKKEE